jgi:hypothetical protein
MKEGSKGRFSIPVIQDASAKKGKNTKGTQKGAFRVEKPNPRLKQVGKEQNNQRYNQRQKIEKDFYVKWAVRYLF